MIRTSLTALLLLTVLLPAMAQAPGPKIVTATASVKTPHVVRGGHSVLNVNLTVAPGFHIYTNPTSDADLIPTVVKGTGAKGIVFGKPRYPAGSKLSISYKEKPLKVYTGKTTIAVPFTVTKAAKPGAAAVTGVISYQGCNATSCYPPATLSVKSAVTVQ